MSVARSARGFTIIETMLFLGITGLLALTLLGGWTTMINTQRYKDSVKTVQSFLQQQYSLVHNVEILERDDNGVYCGVNGSGEVELYEDGAARGQSDCIQMGRLIKITNGTDIKAYAIFGVDIVDDVTTSDIASIASRKPRVVVEEQYALANSELTVPWQAEIEFPSSEGGGQQDVSLAIIRSPLTGSVHTYAANTPGGVISEIDDFIAAANEREVNLCMDPGTAFSGDRIGVVIKARASSQSFVQTIQDESLC